MVIDTNVTVRILAFAGSSREGSWNKKLAAIAANGARHTGAEVTTVDLANYQMPIYDGDLEEKNGPPQEAAKLKFLMTKCDGFLIASPEYNGGYSPLLKNTIDWISRPSPGEPGLAAFAGKTAALMSVSPSVLGGIRGLAQLRQILTNIQVIVLPDQVALPNAHTAFNDNGSLSDEAQNDKVIALGASLARFTQRLR
jgi:chromate reductase